MGADAAAAPLLDGGLVLVAAFLLDEDLVSGLSCLLDVVFAAAPRFVDLFAVSVATLLEDVFVGTEAADFLVDRVSR